MDNFDYCVEHVLKSEGGFSNHPNDSGGPTNFGITQADYARYKGVTVSADDVKNMKREEALAIYREQYWVAMKLDRVHSKPVALILFDQGVNRGTKTAIKNLQAVLNEYFGEKIEVDGILGNKTDVAISTAPEKTLCRKLIQNAQMNYAAIVEHNPTQLVFLKGWLARTFALADAIA